jgi:hypothetical protein
MMYYEFCKARISRFDARNYRVKRLITTHYLELPMPCDPTSLTNPTQSMSTPRTTSIQSRDSIVALLDKRKNARANRLSDRFEVRERPIQKDLVTVEKKGMGHGDSQGETYAFRSQPVQAHRENVIANWPSVTLLRALPFSSMAGAQLCHLPEHFEAIFKRFAL